MPASPESAKQRALAAASCALVAVLTAWAPLTRYLEKPPVAHTGGFSEPSCHSCHFDGSPNDPAGSLTLVGVPEAYEAGRTYRLLLRLAHPELGAGGFQLSARHAAGTQAGALRVADERGAVTVFGDDRIEYAHHVAAGATPSEEGAATWTIEWTAPEEPAGPVLFHVAGNAANGDRSELGDHIYLGEYRTSPRASSAVRKQR